MPYVLIRDQIATLIHDAILAAQKSSALPAFDAPRGDESIRKPGAR